MSRVVSREARAEDAPALTALFARVFGTEMPEEEWRWKYERNPVGSLGVVGEKDGRIVAFYGGWGIRLVGAAGDLRALVLSDTMTDPEVRGAGRRPVLADLDETFVPHARSRGFSLCVGFPNAVAARFGRKWLGYRILGPLRRFGCGVGELRGSGAPFVSTGDSFPESQDAFSERLAALPGLRPDRSREFSNWRFHARPGRYYRVIVAGDSADHLQGAAVAIVAGEIGLLLDLSVAEPGFLPTLLAEVARDLSGSGARRLEVGTTEGPMAEALRGLSFDEGDDENLLGVRDLAEEGQSLRLAPLFDFRLGENDVF